MIFIHILNYTIPIAFMIFFGFLLDRMCRPAPALQESETPAEDQADKQPMKIQTGI
ncbi:hypothetical protein [Neobacillus piezotolerans]|uniref:hypothetical protein n=1 Tax=Neobacillus piezotolerans TaxID=2259171 RepID=UPI0015F16F9D|nr:hypothetical protein [Neobacillus piezotolerans]